MTNAEKKRRLLRYRELEEYIGDLEKELRELAAGQIRVTPSYSPMPLQHGNGRGIEEAYIRDDLRKEYVLKELRRSREEQRDIIQTVNNIEDIAKRRVMRAIYLLGDTLREAADRCHYSYDRARHLHSEALCEIDIKS